MFTASVHEILPVTFGKMRLQHSKLDFRASCFISAATSQDALGNCPNIDGCPALWMERVISSSPGFRPPLRCRADIVEKGSIICTNETITPRPSFFPGTERKQETVLSMYSAFASADTLALAQLSAEVFHSHRTCEYAFLAC